MFFSDNTILGDTSSSTTYEVSGELTPNISQYGWTKADQGHYNQLVSYVNDCRGYFESTAMIGEYAKEAIKELIRIEGLILYINTESDRVESLAAQIDKDTKQSGVYNTGVTSMHQGIQLILAEIRTKYDEIVAIGLAADADAESAKQDATLAGDYYLRTKAMYDEWKAAQP